MLIHMTLQSLFSFELLPTNATESILSAHSKVDSAVSNQVLIAVKASVADRTLEGLLSRMGPQMSRVVELSRERFATDLTDERGRRRESRRRGNRAGDIDLGSKRAFFSQRQQTTRSRVNDHGSIDLSRRSSQ
jgi:hypothetical protein